MTNNQLGLSESKLKGTNTVFVIWVGFNWIWSAQQVHIISSAECCFKVLTPTDMIDSYYSETFILNVLTSSRYVKYWRFAVPSGLVCLWGISHSHLEESQINYFLCDLTVTSVTLFQHFSIQHIKLYLYSQWRFHSRRNMSCIHKTMHSKILDWS